MQHISQDNLLNIWSELWQSYYHDNHYGTDTAEIYTYSYMEYSPIAANWKINGKDKEMSDICKEEYLQANKTLYEILKKFKEKTGCKIYIDERILGKWLLKDINDYRRHIQIKK